MPAEQKSSIFSEGRWLVLLTVIIGTFMGRLDSTIIGAVAYFHPCRLYDGAKLGKGLSLAALGRKDEARVLLEAYAKAYPDDTRMLKVIEEALK